MKTYRVHFILFFVAMTFPSSAQHDGSVKPNDTLVIYQTSELPFIDAKEDDRCWDKLPWQPIDQPWIPYGETVEAADYFGEYKICWSKNTNVLYFIVKITDDVFVDGYAYNSDIQKGDFYYQYDLLEVFIDEDQSGGFHVFNGDTVTAPEWGSNEANAFSYHMILNEPENLHTAHAFVACDLTGKSWGYYSIANYVDHFSDFAMRKSGTEYIWEFSVKVYSDAYDPNNKELSRVLLNHGKPMGISLAYCDNDDRNENPKTRDNFFGSVSVPQKANNDHWKNADLYRKVLLSGEIR